MKTIYDIEDGHIFTGTIEQFEDCFGGAGGDPAGIRAFCANNGWKLTTQQVAHDKSYPTLAENVEAGYIDKLSN
jgi:hypothetical protein